MRAWAEKRERYAYLQMGVQSVGMDIMVIVAVGVWPWWQ